MYSRLVNRGLESLNAQDTHIENYKLGIIKHFMLDVNFIFLNETNYINGIKLQRKNVPLKLVTTLIKQK